MARKSEDLPTLVAQTGPLNGQRWMLNREIVLGREDTCQIVIPNRQVSRYHARLTPGADGTLLEDLGSKNGTHCNGEVVVDPVLLQDGDVIQVALAQEFVYLSSDATLPLEIKPPQENAEPAPTIEYRLRMDKRSHRVWVMDRELLPLSLFPSSKCWSSCMTARAGSSHAPSWWNRSGEKMMPWASRNRRWTPSSAACATAWPRSIRRMLTLPPSEATACAWITHR